MQKVLFGKRPFETELIIFDKDGTIADFGKTWLPVLGERLEIIFDEIPDLPVDRIRSRLYKVYGIEGEVIDPFGPFPYSPPWEDEIIITMVLYEAGVPWQKGKAVTRYAIEKAEERLDRTSYDVLFEGVAEALECLKKDGLLISLATADLTDIAEKTLKNAGIHHLFDYIIGADKVQNDKPDPEMVLKTVEALQADIGKTALVGDTITDMEMGRRAEVGLIVGVTEGGIASEEHLRKDADVVIASVRDIRTA